MGWRVVDQRQTYNMGSGGRLQKVWEITVDTDEGPSFNVEVPDSLYFNTDAVKAKIDEHYKAVTATHGLTG
jgi:hypothetical protein